jgi:phage terminase large subunit GpA-like protein
MLDAAEYAAGRERLRAALREALRRNLAPPPKLTLSQWAAEHAVLSRETSAQTGRFHAFPYQPGIMDAVTDPTVTTITVQKSARVGYTKILDHVVGYFIHQDPSPILMVQPRVEDAEDYSGTEIEPMLRDTRVLAEITGNLKAKDSKQKLLKRVFRNGASVAFVGANSPGGFRRITARIILFDEVDGYPISGAGTEGDQVRLGAKRAESFWNKKVVLGSTPTVKGYSRIEKSFAESDQRRFWVPCPHCGEFQVLEWGGPDTPYGFKWDKDDKGVGLPETTHYVCRHNGCVIVDADKPDMLAGGEWRAGRPFKGHAGFHIWTAYSLFPNAAWPNLVAEWLSVKDDPLARQTFINTTLGEPYEDAGDRALQEAKLAARGEIWADEVPDGVAVITHGVDVQDYRVEIETVGWGHNEESWSLEHHVIDGEFSEPSTQAQLDEYLKRTWRRVDGRRLEAMATCIDSGGHHTQAVYGFAKARLARRVWAVKGESARFGQRSPVWPTKRPSARNKQSFRPVILGVNAAKDVVRQRLHLEQPGPGYMHFPADRDIGYFSQLTSERSITKTMDGVRFRVWELPPGRANEALDCRVYAYGALCGLTHLGLQLNRTVERMRTEPVPAEEHAAVAAPAPAAGPTEERQMSIVQTGTTRGKSLASRLA